MFHYAIYLLFVLSLSPSHIHFFNFSFILTFYTHIQLVHFSCLIFIHFRSQALDCDVYLLYVRQLKCFIFELLSIFSNNFWFFLSVLLRFCYFQLFFSVFVFAMLYVVVVVVIGVVTGVVTIIFDTDKLKKFATHSHFNTFFCASSLVAVFVFFFGLIKLYNQ